MPEAHVRSGADIRECRELLRRNSRTFHAASLLLPGRVRAPASALYAFCRVADDAVDLVEERLDDAVARLRLRLARVYAGTPLPLAPDRAFADVVDRYAIPRALPEALLEGFAWDAAGRRYEDLSELCAYGARVAGSVGAMMAVLMGARDPERLARACDLGVAMQLTNIARDVGEDARAGRLYLPLSWMREAGLDPDAWLASPAFDARLAAVVARLLAAADGLYRRADAGIGRLPYTCRPAMHAARRLYSEIGRTVEARGHDSVSRRAVVPATRKATLLCAAFANAFLPTAGEAAPPLPETAYLVEALHGHPVPQAAASPARRPSTGFDDKAAWLFDLFGRLEMLEHGAQPQRSSAGG
jgi:phytoene synthase